jgi:ribosome maturation factor RimP
MSVKSEIGKILNELITEPYYLVDFSVSESKIRTKISVFADTDEGISIDQCGELSHKIGEALEAYMPSKYTLEVSSPGVDTRLKFTRQYLKNINRTLKLHLIDGSELVGELLNATESGIEIKPEAKKKVIIENKVIDYNQIKDAKVVLKFK